MLVFRLYNVDPLDRDRRDNFSDTVQTKLSRQSLQDWTLF